MRARLLELEKMAGGKFVDDLLIMLITESTERMEKLGRALQKQDFAESEHLFHQIQGGAASTGAKRLRTISAFGQKACSQSKLLQAEHCLKLAHKEITRLKVFQRQWRTP